MGSYPPAALCAEEADEAIEQFAVVLQRSGEAFGHEISVPEPWLSRTIKSSDKSEAHRILRRSHDRWAPTTRHRRPGTVGL